MQATDILVGIKASQLEIGTTVPYAVYNKSGRLLFAKDRTVANESQKLHLIRDGLFLIEFPGSEQTIQSLVSQLTINLSDAFEKLENQAHEAFVRSICLIALHIQHHCAQRQDALLGAVHSDHDSEYWLIHPIHCAVICEIVAKSISMPQLDRLSLLKAALTQNISFYKEQQALHAKDPDSELSDQEETLIRTHPMRSYEMLIQAGINDNFWLDAVRNHHERIDGSGYPFRLKEFLVSTPSKIIAIADIYAAATRSRTYREELLSKDAMQEIFNERGKSVCEHLTKSFVSQISIYPPGTYVKLANKEIGIVKTRTNEISKPLVSIIIDEKNMPYDTIQERDSSEPEFTIVQVLPFDQFKQLEPWLVKLWPKFNPDD
jgi:HD-GYP domain-containing protein (c-di-GMP phosphodiesterase class II)